MSRLTLKSASGSIAAADAVGYDAPLSNPRDALYAAYFHGTDYFIGTTGYTPLSDVSDHAGRGATLTGVGAANAAMATSVTAYLELPFTGANLCAAKGACTMFSLHKTPAAQAAALASNRNTVTAGVQSILLWTSISVAVAASTVDGTTSRLASIGAASDRDTIADYEAVASVHTATSTSVFRKVKGGTLQKGSITYAALTVGGAANIRIGREQGASLTGTSSHAIDAFYADALTDAEVEGVLDDLLEMADAYGIQPA